MWNPLQLVYDHAYDDEDDDLFCRDNDNDDNNDNDNDYDDCSDSCRSYLSCDDDLTSISGDDHLKQPILAAISESRLKDLKRLMDSSDLSLDMYSECLSYAVSCDQMLAAKLILSSTCPAVDVSNNRTQQRGNKVCEKFLAFAVDRGNEKLVKLLLNEGVVNSTTSDLQSSIHFAVQRQLPQIVEHLLIHGADVNAPSPHDYGEECTLLHKAVERGSESIVKLLVNFGAGVNAAMADGSTPLHLAARAGFLEIAKFLSQEGAHINCTVAPILVSGRGTRFTPLQAAILNGRKEMVKLLLESGADVNARDSHGKMVFQHAVERMCPEILTYVLDYCPEVNDENGRCALHSVVSSIRTENTKIILQKLLQYGFAFSHEDSHNADLLFGAVRGNFLDVTKSLLKYGAKINEPYSGSDLYFNFCSSLLHVAVISGYVNMTKLLMEHGANPDIRNADGKTPLLFAVALSDSEIAKLLFERGANVLNEELLVLAVEKNSIEVIKMIVEKGINMNKKVSVESQLCEKLSCLRKFPHSSICETFDTVFYKKPRTALDLATDLGHLEVVKLLLDKGADIDCTSDGLNMPLLSLSAREGHLEIVELLLKKGSEITAAAISVKTALHEAAKFGHYEVVKLLLKYGAEFSTADEAGKPPHESVLDVAIQANAYKVVKLLLEYGANVSKSTNLQTCLTNLIKERESQTVELLLKCEVNINARNSWENSLLYVAAQVNSKKLVQLLLDHNLRTYGVQEASAFINFANSDGETALHVAAERGGTEVVKVLLKYGAFVNCKTHYGATPLSISAGKGHLKIVETLLEDNADINCTDEERRSPLYNASDEGHVRIVQLLVKRGAGSDIETSFGETPLSISSKKGYLDIVEALINSKAFINPADEEQSSCHPPEDGLVLNVRQQKSSSPLYNAAAGGHIEIVKLLLENRAKIDITHRDGETPLSISASKGHFKTVKVLLEAGAVANSTAVATSPLCNATRNGHVKVVKLLLENGAVTETKDRDSETPLLIASKQKNVNIIKTLLTFGANIESSDVKGKTALHHAIRRGQYEIVELLLQHGAKVDSKDVDGRTPLIISIQLHGRRKDFEMKIDPGSVEAEESSGRKYVKILLKYGANVDVQNAKGETPLFISAKYRQLESVKALLEAGANTRLSDSYGRTALYIAATKPYSEGIVKSLLDYGAKIDTVTLNKLKYVLLDFLYDDNFPDVSNSYYDTGSKEMDLGAAKIVAYHFVKMKTLNLSKGTEIFEALNIGKKTELSEFQYKCELEVSRMMKEYIGDTSLSFYKILKISMDQLAAVTKNNSVVKILTTGDHKIKFPIYADIIDIQIRKGELRKDLMEQGVKLFYYLIYKYADTRVHGELLKLYDVVEKILRYLSIKDLRMFIHACKPIEVFLSNSLLSSSSLEDLDLFD